MSKKKGAAELDYIIAIGIFIIIIGVVINYMTNYFTTAEDSIRIMALQTEADSMMRISDFGFYPDNWTNESYPDRIGLQSYVYRFFILVNNTQSHLLNQSQNVTSLSAELVSFNYTTLGLTVVDYNSTLVYNDTDGVIGCSISGDKVTFNASVSANSARWFTVYFDDDSNFTNMSVPVGGTDNIDEKIFAVEKISLLQYEGMQRLQAADYGKIKNSTGMLFDMNINITDVDTGATVFAFGENVSYESNIVSLQRFVAYQNSTAAIRKGRIITRVW
ncbi:MAG: hypothetical protein HZB67_02585 [Candidatus Aenigmarchaeota archaeon]|nr:hypothetical protein [Candidatus Aenigmarchaeota archaeon]